MEHTQQHVSKLQALFKQGARVTYAKGDTIIRPEDTPQGVFLIDSGFVKSYDITKYGEENLLVIRKKNQMFPILWTLTDERTAVYYQAMTDTVLYRIDRKTYLDKLEHDDGFSRDVLAQVLEMYQIHSQRVLNLEYRTAAERIAFRILILADRFGEKVNGGIEIKAPMRHQDIAESVNCSRETASREIAKLQKKKFIRSSNGMFVVMDPEGLINMVGVQESMKHRFLH